MPYPTDDDPIVRPQDGVDEQSVASLDPLFDSVDALMVYVGPDTATASSSGTLTEQINYLLAQPGGIAKQDAAPGSPTEDDLWLDTDDADRPLTIRVSSTWQLIGANALELDGTPVDAAAPTNGQVLTYNSTSGEWEAAAASGGMSNPMTTLGDLIYGAAAGAATRLGIGSAGQFLGVASGLPEWQTPNYIAAPGSPAQGDVLYHNGSTWVRLAAGTTGQFLKTLGASNNPLWATPPSAAPGDGIPAPAGQAQGDILFFDGTDWDNLAPGTSGLFLKTNGAGANPAWAAPAGGMTNPMTTLADLIIGGSGGTPARLGIGATNQILTVVAGAPAWATAAVVAAPDYVTALFYS